jgi:hypothetical protein
MNQNEKPAACLTTEGARDLSLVQKAVEGIRELREQIAKDNEGKPPITESDVKSWIEEGRK